MWGNIKCVVSKQHFPKLFKGLSQEIATPELQSFSLKKNLYVFYALDVAHKQLTTPSVETNLHLSEWIPLFGNGRRPHYSLLLLVMLHFCLQPYTIE